MAAAGCPVIASSEDDIAPVGVDVVGATKVYNNNDGKNDDDNEEKLLHWRDEVLPPYTPKMVHPPPKVAFRSRTGCTFMHGRSIGMGHSNSS